LGRNKKTNELSAKEYLDLLIADADSSKSALPSNFFIEDILASARSAYSPTNREIVAYKAVFGQNPSGKTNLEIKAERLLDTMPDRELLAAIPVGWLPIKDFNAMVLAPNGDPLILITLGLWTLVSRIASCFIASVRIDDSGPEDSFENASRDAFLYAMSFTHNRDLLSSATRALQTSERRAIVGMMTYNATNFVLGHEYAHVLLGHLHRANPKRKPSRTAGWQILRRSRTQEQAADIKAFEIATGFSRSHHNGEILPAVLGIAILFYVFQLTEVCESGSHPSTHPSAMERMRAFEDWLKPYETGEIKHQLKSMRYFFDITIANAQDTINTIRRKRAITS
jgi:hypothetical protein